MVQPLGVGVPESVRGAGGAQRWNLPCLARSPEIGGPAVRQTAGVNLTIGEWKPVSYLVGYPGENRKTTRLSDSGDVRPLASGDARLWADPGSFSLSTTRAEGLALMIVIHRRHLAPTPTNKQRFAQSCPAHSTASRCFIASPEHRHKPE